LVKTQLPHQSKEKANDNDGYRKAPSCSSVAVFYALEAGSASHQALVLVSLGVELQHTVKGAPLDGSSAQFSEFAFFLAMIAGAFLENVLSNALLRILFGVELEHAFIAAQLGGRDFTIQSTEHAFVDAVIAGAFLGGYGQSSALLRIFLGVELGETVSGALDRSV